MWGISNFTQLKFSMPAASPDCCGFCCWERVGTLNFWKILAHKLQIILHCGWKKKILECFISSSVTLPLNIFFLLMFLSGTAAWQLVVYKVSSRGKRWFTHRGQWCKLTNWQWKAVMLTQTEQAAPWKLLVCASSYLCCPVVSYFSFKRSNPS